MKKKKSILFNFLIIFLFLFGFKLTAQTYYVTQNGIGDGSSWANASGDLQATINAATAGSQIWVASGSYYPNRRADAVTVISPNDRNDAFVLKANVQLYGGFIGTETNLTDAKWNYNQTILSGDIGTVGNTADNCYHVVVGSGNAGIGILNGFNIVKGNANGGSSITVNGNGIANNIGGGLCLLASNVSVINCIFSNTASSSGGGIYMDGNSNPVIQSCVFYNNTAGSSGGGMYIGTLSSPINITNSIFANNTAGLASSAGGAASIASPCSFINCTFFKNYSSGTLYGEGATIAVYYYPVTLSNCISWYATSNRAGYDFWRVLGGSFNVTYSDIQNPSTAPSSSNANANSDPSFTNINSLLGPDGLWATPDDGLVPSATTPIANAGSNALITAGVTTDITGAPRIQANTVDMGAYETALTTTPIALPLQLVSFFGITINGYNQLQWQTAKEINTKDFDVEYSLDAINFRTIGVVAANGTGGGTYHFSDLISSQTVFYRLKMVDIDGRFTYSGIIKLGSLNNDVKSSSLFPNPATSTVTLTIGNQSLIGTKAVLADQSGKLLQNLTINGISQIINVEKYGSGVYYLKLDGGETLKIIKQQ